MRADKKTPTKTLLPVKKGDKLRDCDPRQHGAEKDVVDVDKNYVTVQNPGAKKSVIRRDRIHDKADRKSGYFLVRA